MASGNKANDSKSATGDKKMGDSDSATDDATGDPQKSLTLSTSNIQRDYAQDGMKG